MCADNINKTKEKLRKKGEKNTLKNGIKEEKCNLPRYNNLDVREY